MPIPIEIKLHQVSQTLEVSFDDQQTFSYSTEFLRVYSQSAEVTGHAPGQETLQVGKQDVNIDAISPVGNYAVRLHFSDGHDSGIYTWERLYDLGEHYQKYWVAYLRQLMRAGHSHPELTKLQKESGK
ncbi:MAG: DUF971 domain-containing protein [Thiomicrospira sp.]|jgi:DUF971 family protein|nr:DUF971 domain-containing protein [Thiomicrospira sp.]